MIIHWIKKNLFHFCSSSPLLYTRIYFILSFNSFEVAITIFLKLNQSPAIIEGITSDNINLMRLEFNE